MCVCVLQAVDLKGSLRQARNRVDYAVKVNHDLSKATRAKAFAGMGHIDNPKMLLRGVLHPETVPCGEGTAPVAPLVKGKGKAPRGSVSFAPPPLAAAAEEEEEEENACMETIVEEAEEAQQVSAVPTRLSTRLSRGGRKSFGPALVKTPATAVRTRLQTLAPTRTPLALVNPEEETPAVVRRILHRA